MLFDLDIPGNETRNNLDVGKNERSKIEVYEKPSHGANLNIEIW
jgi:hypothetical protein